MRIHDLQDLKQMLSIVTVDDERSLDRIEWTDDGQLMAVSSARGIVHVYLSNLPIIGNILFIFFQPHSNQSHDDSPHFAHFQCLE